MFKFNHFVEFTFNFSPIAIDFLFVSIDKRDGFVTDNLFAVIFRSGLSVSLFNWWIAGMLLLLLLLLLELVLSTKRWCDGEIDVGVVGVEGNEADAWEVDERGDK